MGVAFLSQPFGEGASQQQVFAPDAPGAGASFAQPLGGAHVRRLVTCVFTLTTSAVVANRYVTLQYVGGDGTPFCVMGAGVVVLASSVQRFAGSMYQSVGQWAAGTDVFFPITPLYLYGSDTLTVNVGGVDAGDTLTGLRFLFDRFLEAYPAQ